MTIPLAASKPSAYDAHKAAILRALEAGPATAEQIAAATGRTVHTVAYMLALLVGHREVRQIQRFRRCAPTKWRTGYELARPSPDQRLTQARAMLAQGLTLDEAAWCLDLTDAETNTLVQEASP